MAADEGKTKTVQDALDAVDALRERSLMRAMVEDVVRWFAEHDLDEARARFAARLRLRDA